MHSQQPGPKRMSVKDEDNVGAGRGAVKSSQCTYLLLERLYFIYDGKPKVSWHFLRACETRPFHYPELAPLIHSRKDILRQWGKEGHHLPWGLQPDCTSCGSLILSKMAARSLCANLKKCHLCAFRPGHIAWWVKHALDSNFHLPSWAPTTKPYLAALPQLYLMVRITWSTGRNKDLEITPLKILIQWIWTVALGFCTHDENLSDSNDQTKMKNADLDQALILQMKSWRMKWLSQFHIHWDSQHYWNKWIPWWLRQSASEK